MRKHELLLLNQLRYNSQVTDDEFEIILKKNKCYLNEDVLYSVDRILSLEFFVPKEQKILVRKLRRINMADEPLLNMLMVYIF